MKKVQREPEFQSSSIHRVLVVSLSKNPQTRQTLEDEFVRQWRKKGVEALASHDVLPVGTPLEKTHVASFAQTNAYDSVLVSRLLGRNKIDPQIRGEEFDTDVSTSDASLTEYSQAVVASPAYSQDYEMAVVTANVYDVRTEKKVWSGTTQTLVTEDVHSVIPGYVKVILKSLYEKQ